MIYIQSPFYEAVYFVNYMYVFVHREIGCVPLVEQVLLTLTDNLGSSPVFRGVHVAQPLVFSVVFYRSLLFMLCFCH